MYISRTEMNTQVLKARYRTEPYLATTQEDIDYSCNHTRYQVPTTWVSSTPHVDFKPLSREIDPNYLEINIPWCVGMRGAVTKMEGNR